MTESEWKSLRADQLLSRYGYCSRREAGAWIRAGRLTRDGEPVRDARERLDATAVRVDGAPVEFPKGLLVMLNKPAGVVCSRDAREGRTVFDLLPPQWSRRQPPVTTVGRLDRETTGLILITDVGELVHRWTSPRRHVEKVYEVVVDQPLRSELVERFASGRLWLEGESRPCLPARLELTGEREARVVLTEGKYHQVRRMFAAEGFCVVRLHRSRFGEFELGDLAEGSWREAPLPGA